MECCTSGAASRRCRPAEVLPPLSAALSAEERGSDMEQEERLVNKSSTKDEDAQVHLKVDEIGQLMIAE